MNVVTLPQTLYKLPNGIADEYNVVSGTGTKKINHAIFSGTESWEWADNSANSTTITRFNLAGTGIKPSEDIFPHLYCDRFPNIDSLTVETIRIHGTIDQISIFILKSRLTGWSDLWTDAQKVDAFKSWLILNQVNVLYELNTYNNINSNKQYIKIDGEINTNIYTNNSANINVDYINERENISKQDNYIYIKTLKKFLSEPNMDGFLHLLDTENVNILYSTNVVDSSTPLDITYYSPLTIIKCENGMIDCTYTNKYYKSDAYVQFDKGFEINGDMLIQLKAQNLIPNQKFKIFYNGNNDEVIQIYYLESNFSDSNGLVGYFNLKVLGKEMTYSINSEYIRPMSLYSYPWNIWIRRVNNIYEIKVNNQSITVNDLINSNITVDSFISKHITVYDLIYSDPSILQ